MPPPRCADETEGGNAVLAQVLLMCWAIFQIEQCAVNHQLAVNGTCAAQLFGSCPELSIAHGRVDLGVNVAHRQVFSTPP